MRTDRARRPERGSATVEFAVLLPAYALVVLVSLYFGWARLIQQEGYEGNLYAAHRGGDDTPDLSDHFYRYYEGAPDLRLYPWGTSVPWPEKRPWGGDIFSPNNPTSGNDPFDLHDILQELSYTFWGGFELEGGDLVWRTRGGRNATGQYIQEHNIMGTEELESQAWMLNEWVTRRIAATDYDFDPWFLGGMNAESGPAAGNVAETPFDPLRLETKVDVMRRGDRERELLSAQRGVASRIHELIDRFHDAEEMPGYPDFGQSADWWDPRVRPDLP